MPLAVVPVSLLLFDRANGRLGADLLALEGLTDLANEHFKALIIKPVGRSNSTKESDKHLLQTVATDIHQLHN